MKNVGVKNPSANLSYLGISARNVYWNLAQEELIETTIATGQGVLADSGALVVNTGKFTGRDPKNRFIVKDAYTSDVAWGDVNFPFDADKFDKLYDKVVAYFEDKDVWVQEGMACANPKYELKIRAITEFPWMAGFVHNMFMRPTHEQLNTFSPEWTILNAPGFQADPEVDGTKAPNFAILNFTRKVVLIGGTGYTGEIKKGIFSALNYLLPKEEDVLTMHCSSNIGKDGDTAVFFGLSGTGKTTLSADPNRELIGDDEHGWSEEGVFNFEGGCYAKTIDLSAEKEPDIWAAIKHGAILENIGFLKGARAVDFADTSITQNTRVSYPIYHIHNAAKPSMGGVPKNIFFLTADAFGVLPPISKLTPGQAMYHFISGYTAKVAGTEVGIVDPVATFSSCFGEPFLPHHPTVYAEMLGDKIRKFGVNVWLVNTGWVGGGFGVGNRISLKYTRAMITAAMQGELNSVEYVKHHVFGLEMPVACPNVPSELLNPRKSWKDTNAYDKKANYLASIFIKNFSKFADKANDEIMNAAPKVVEFH